MMNNQNNPSEINPELIEKINLLESTPKRDPELVAKNRQKFIAEVESLTLAESNSGFRWLIGLLKSNNEEGSIMNTGKKKFAVSTFAAILLVVVVLFGGASATAYASQSALPGDALYTVKTSLEQAQITLANDAYDQARLHLDFALRRLNEIKELLAQGRTNDVEFASNEFEHYIQEAMIAAQIVQAADSERGAELNKLVSQALLDYASALKSVLIAAPESVKPVVERALLISQDGAGDEVEIFGVVGSITDAEIDIDGKLYSITGLTEFKDFIKPGDMVKIHVIVTQDGAMVVREIELSIGADDNSNSSGDDNSNESVDGNENENESDDDINENGSGDDSNGNESDDDLNENGNEFEEDNSNESGSDDNTNDNNSDDSSENSGSSNNDNDDDSNDNSGKDSSNDNDSDDSNNSNDSDDNDNDKDDD